MNIKLLTQTELFENADEKIIKLVKQTLDNAPSAGENLLSRLGNEYQKLSKELKMKSGYDIYLDFLAGKTGGFHTNLCEAVACADKKNTVKLATVYPGVVDAHRLYSNVGLHEFLDRVDGNPLVKKLFSEKEISEAKVMYESKSRRVDDKPIIISDDLLKERLGW